MEKSPIIHCETHGNLLTCVACKHLRTGSGLRYYAERPDPDIRPDAWEALCERCSDVLNEEEGWTERAEEFAGGKRLCAECYQLTLRRHRRLHGDASGRLAAA